MRSLKMVLRRRFAYFEVKDILAEYNSADSAGVDKLNPRLELFAKDLPLKTFSTKSLAQSSTRPPRLKHNLERLVRAEGIYPVEQINKLNNDE